MREIEGDDVTLDVLIDWASDPSRCLSFPRFDPICAAREGYPTEEWCWPCTARKVLGVICELGFAALAERSFGAHPMTRIEEIKAAQRAPVPHDLPQAFKQLAAKTVAIDDLLSLAEEARDILNDYATGARADQRRLLEAVRDGARLEQRRARWSLNGCPVPAMRVEPILGLLQIAQTESEGRYMSARYTLSQAGREALERET